MSSIPQGKVFSYFIIAVLALVANLTAFAFQFFYHELPCPLCLMQRFGILAIGFGAVMTMLYGKKFKYDLLIVVSSVYTLAVALRQVLLHILPNDPGYGSLFLGLHFYTWSAILSFILIFVVFLSPVAFISDKLLPRYFSNVPNILRVMFIILSIANSISTCFECGISQCPENPTSYEL